MNSSMETFGSLYQLRPHVRPTHVFRQNLPRGLYDRDFDDLEELTIDSAEENEDLGSLEFLDPTGWNEVAFTDSYNQADIQNLYGESGLTWKQLADLIGVSSRTIHFWISGEKKISKKHADVVAHLSRLISILDLGAAYRVRSFFQDDLFKSKIAMRFLAQRRFSSLEEWAQKKNAATRRPLPLQTDLSLLSSKLPDRPFFQNEIPESGVLHKTGKMRRVKVSRARSGRD